jgi:cytochrome P450
MDFDLADPAFWARPQPERLAAFEYLRQLDKPVFVTESAATAKHDAKGYYAIVRHEHVNEISRNARVFSSEPGVTTPLPNPIVSFVFGESMVNMDNPRHGRLRAIVQRAFSPGNLAKVEEDIERVAKRAAAELEVSKPDDFVTSVASQVPFQVLSNMMGIPEKHRPMILDRIFQTTERAHADHALKRIRLPGRGTLAMIELQLLVMRIAKNYRREPGNDIMSALVNTEVDGHRLGYRDLGAFFNTLLVAGIETTRNELVHFLHLLSKHPDQRELLLSDFDRYIAGAIEEVIRFEPSIFQFRRHVKEEYELGGVHLKPGDQVAIFFHSANRDEAVFSNPNAFDITRDPNPHVGFGAGGPHVCLGKLVARKEMTYLYKELYQRFPNMRSVGDPPMYASNFDNRILRLEFTL